MTFAEIEQVISAGSAFEKGKYRICRYFSRTHSKTDSAEFLRKEYGIGGRSWDFPDGCHGWMDYNAAGLEITKEASEGVQKTTMSWAEVATHVDYLIANGKYLTEDESNEYCAWIANGAR